MFNKAKLAFRVLQGVAMKDHPSLLVFFVTSRCNARCSFCFNLENILVEDKPPEITLDEIEKIAKSLYPLPQLLLSGGEPFLRKDVADLVHMFYKHAGTRQISIPTNGALPNRIVPSVQAMLEKCSDAYININISVDAIGEPHDISRKVPGCYEKLCETFEQLVPVREAHPNLSINMLSCIKADNSDSVPELINHIRDNFDVNYHFAGLVRGDVEAVEKDFDIHVAEKQIEDLYKDRGGIRKIPVFNRIAPAVSRLLSKILDKARQESERAFECRAGRKIIVLSHDAELYPCEPLWLEPEVRDGAPASQFVLADLKDFDFDVMKALASRQAQGVNDFVDENKCACCYGCAISNSIIYTPKMYPKVIKELIS
jgi:molybdenum cofactor biosynthesis enzyme MoaA